MVLIDEITDEIEDELEDAEKYIDRAFLYKTERPGYAQTCYTNSVEEMEHAKRLHNDVEGIIREYRAKNGEPPAPMMAVYNRRHKKYNDYAAKIKLKQQMFRES